METRKNFERVRLTTAKRKKRNQKEEEKMEFHREMKKVNEKGDWVKHEGLGKKKTVFLKRNCSTRKKGKNKLGE